MLWTALITNVALASSTAGMGISPLGGGLAGLTEPGVLGLVMNPAAARSQSIEGAIDVGLSLYSMNAQLEGSAAVQTSDAAPLPYIGITIPLYDFGVGLYAMTPYGGGISLPEDSPHRFHVITSKSFLLEAGLSVAYQPVEWMKAGASFRVGRGSLSKRAAINTASLVNSKTDLSPPLDTEDPLFMGEQDLDLSGTGMGYGLGFSFYLPEQYELHLAYRSPMKVPLSGPITLLPSDDLSISVDGQAEGAIQYAREFELGLVVPAGDLRIALSGGYVDWSPLAVLDVTVGDLKLSSNDQTAEALIVESGLNDSGLLDTELEIKNDLGHHGTLHGGVAVGVPIGQRWLIRPGVFYAPTTLPDSSFHASIADFTSIDLRLSTAYSPTDWLTLGVSVDHFIIPDRDIKTSSLSLDNPSHSGRVLPSANGLYEMDATRVGLTVIARK